MKTTSSTLISYLNTVRGSADATLIMADAFTFTLRAGSVLCYTNADVTFGFTSNSVNYTALANSVLVDGLKYKASVGLEVDQQKITIAALAVYTIPGGAPFLQALVGGAFDGCEIVRYRVFFSDRIGGTVIGAVMLFKGRVGPVEQIGRASAQITVNSDLVLLDNDMPRNGYQPTCLHTLYDDGCTLSKATFSSSGTVAAGSSVSIIYWSGANANFQQGTITFTSGVNGGATATVGSAAAGQLTLIYPLENAPAAGDTFTVAYGCDHTPATCTAKFNNFANFRGFPYVPPPQMAI